MTCETLRFSKHAIIETADGYDDHRRDDVALSHLLGSDDSSEKALCHGADYRVGFRRNTRKTVTNPISRTLKLSCDRALEPSSVLAARRRQCGRTAPRDVFDEPAIGAVRAGAELIAGESACIVSKKIPSVAQLPFHYHDVMSQRPCRHRDFVLLCQR